MSFAKDGRLVSKVFLAFGARQECFAGRSLSYGKCQGRITLHHYPPKGMGGASHRDDRIVPLCECHHDRAQQYRIDVGVQDSWVDELRSRFMEQATPAEWDAFCADRKRWSESRVYVEEIPA